MDAESGRFFLKFEKPQLFVLHSWLSVFFFLSGLAHSALPDTFRGFGRPFKATCLLSRKLLVNTRIPSKVSLLEKTTIEPPSLWSYLKKKDKRFGGHKGQEKNKGRPFVPTIMHVFSHVFHVTRRPFFTAT